MAKTDKNSENKIPEKKKKGAVVSNSAKAGLKVSVPRINTRIVKSRVAERVGATTAVHLAGSVEYFLRELISLACENVEQAGKYKRVKPRDITLCLRSDEDFARLLAGHRILTGDKIKSNASEMMVESDRAYNQFIAEKKKTTEVEAA